MTVEPRGFEVAADWATLKSPENYVGYERTEDFASPGGAARDKPHMYEVPASVTTEQLGAVRRLDDKDATPSN